MKNTEVLNPSTIYTIILLLFTVSFIFYHIGQYFCSGSKLKRTIARFFGNEQRNDRCISRSPHICWSFSLLYRNTSISSIECQRSSQRFVDTGYSQSYESHIFYIRMAPYRKWLSVIGVCGQHTWIRMVAYRILYIPAHNN